jgi:hypothetical protein
MKTTYLAFTSSSYAYDVTKEKATQRLLSELNKRNVKPSSYGIVDVTKIPDGVGITHEPWFCKTDTGDSLEVEVIKLNYETYE